MAESPAGDFWERPIPLQGPAPAYPTGPEVLGDLSAAACGTCHPVQHAAWRESLHAGAVSPGLVGQLGAFDALTQDHCLSCHAPRQEMLDLWAEGGLAATPAMAGVDCATCHLRGHVRHGPRAIPETPHGAVPMVPLYRDAAFCAPCHQFDETGLSVNGKPLENTYAEWEASRYARDGVTCQACHMPDKQHRFKGIHDRDTTRAGLAVQVRRTAEGVQVDAGNVGAGHALPTYVTPRILIRLEGDGGDPTLVHVIARKMRWSQEAGCEELADDRLLPDQWIGLDLDLAPTAIGRVTVRVEPGFDYHERIYPALLDLLEDLSEEERALLEQARQQAAGAAYILYQFACPAWSGREEPCAEQP